MLSSTSGDGERFCLLGGEGDRETSRLDLCDLRDTPDVVGISDDEVEADPAAADFEDTEDVLGADNETCPVAGGTVGADRETCPIADGMVGTDKETCPIAGGTVGTD